MSPYALTADRRRETCVHEAAHAVVAALGGAFVYRVGVAPIGATEWTCVNRRGHERGDLWGICESSGSPGDWFLRWDEAERCGVADWRGFRAHNRAVAEHLPSAPAEIRRQVRAKVCCSLAGEMAAQILRGEPAGVWDTLNGDGWDDFSHAEALTWLLPYRRELDHLHDLTEQALRDPDVWARVLALADELERAGDLDDERLERHLPPRRAGWPRSPRARNPDRLAEAA